MLFLITLENPVGSLQSPGETTVHHQCFPAAMPLAQGGIWDGLGCRGPYQTPEPALRAAGSPWDARAGPLPTDGLAGPAVPEESWEPQPSASLWKAVPANWAPPRQGWGVMYPEIEGQMWRRA